MNNILCGIKVWNTGFTLVADGDKKDHCHGICNECINRGIDSGIRRVECKAFHNQASYCTMSYE
jgi:hypothetical protein